LSVTSLFTLFASIVYNFAIATTDTDLIMNAVIILFINDIDELMNDILIEIFPCEEAEEMEEEDKVTMLKEEHEGMKIRVQQVEEQMKIKQQVEEGTKKKIQQVEEEMKIKEEDMKKKVQQIEEESAATKEALKELREEVAFMKASRIL